MSEYINKLISTDENRINNIPKSPIAKETSPETSPKIPRNRILSPQTSKDKIATMLEKMEFNTKYFPSKANVCKGEINQGSIQFSPPHSRSPIVAYYAGMTNSNTQSAFFSPDGQNKYSDMNFYQYHQNFYMNNRNKGSNSKTNSNQYHNFNFSPSAIFNVDKFQKGSDIQTLQEKIEGNVNEGAKILMKNQKKDNSEIKREEGKDEDGKERLDLLLFNDEEEELNDIEVMEASDSKGEDKDNNEDYEFMLDGFNSIEDNIVSSGLKEKVVNEQQRALEDKRGSEGVKETTTAMQNMEYVNSNQNSQSNLTDQNIQTNPNIQTNQNSQTIQNIQSFSNQNIQNNQSSQNIVQTFQNNINPNKINSDNNPQSMPQEHIINFYSNYINNYYYGPMSNNMKSQYSQYHQYHPKTPQYPLTKSKLRTIPSPDIMLTTTIIIQNNKKIKRIDPLSYINESYEYLSHNLFPLAKDQAGCRFLQKKLDDDPITSTSYFYPSILPYLLQLTKDPFGNYLIQKLFNSLSQEQLMQILTIFSPNITEIGSNPHGTRVLQYMINFFKTPELISYFASIISPNAIPLLKELNGTHVIQKFNTDFPLYTTPITIEVVDHCEDLAFHRHGCCVLQKYLYIKEIELRNRLIKKLVDITNKLVIDQFGNYVVQSILLLNVREYGNEITKRLIQKVEFYSKHKYSSNVVEKCFDYCDEELRMVLVDMLSKKEIVSELILDEHGNYVMQKVLQCADDKKQREIISYIVPMVNKVKCVSFGERIINKLILTYPYMGNLIGKEGKKGGNKKNSKKKGALGVNVNKQ